MRNITALFKLKRKEHNYNSDTIKVKFTGMQIEQKISQASAGNNLYMVLEQILIRLAEHPSSLSLHGNITHTHTHTHPTKDIALLHNHTEIHTYPSLTSAHKLAKKKKIQDRRIS